VHQLFLIWFKKTKNEKKIRIQKSKSKAKNNNNRKLALAKKKIITETVSGFQKSRDYIFVSNAFCFGKVERL